MKKTTVMYFIDDNEHCSQKCEVTSENPYIPHAGDIVRIDDGTLEGIECAVKYVYVSLPEKEFEDNCTLIEAYCSTTSKRMCKFNKYVEWLMKRYDEGCNKANGHYC